MSILTKIFGDPNAKLLRGLTAEVQGINALEPEISALDDLAIKAKTGELKKLLLEGVSLESLTAQAFALVREAAKRTLGQRHYDVQLMGGLVLNRGGIAEMRTGEGKTLTATTAVYLNALEGKGVHVVTVNDYLAKRDTVWMGKIFNFLGLTVGCIQHEGGYRFDEEYKAPTLAEGATVTTEAFRIQTDFLRPASRQEAYAADITYGTNNEFGFDYLRDNMAPSPDRLVQRGLNFAIVDEVDSILIDEARTPLIISAPAEESNELYYKFSDIIKDLKVSEDFNIDEKMRVATFTEQGLQKIEQALGVKNLFESGLQMVHHAEQADRKSVV